MKPLDLPSSLRKQCHATSGFTLLELLVVIAIIALLASGVLFSMQGILEEGKVARTKTQIAKINELIMDRWESYRTRPIRIELSSATPTTVYSGMQPYHITAAEISRLRLYRLRELQRLEMPERISDLLSNTTLPLSSSNPATPTSTAAIPLWYRHPTNAAAAPYVTGNLPAQPLPALFREYQRKIAANGANWSQSHQGAECLYLILSSMKDESGGALSLLAQSEIGDTDGDGMPEILDAWGEPLFFLRWAPGFSDQRGPDMRFGSANTDDDGDGFTDNAGVGNANLANGGLEIGFPGSDDLTFNPSQLQSGNPQLSPDGFDPLKQDPRWSDSNLSNDPFQLIPLIYSGGPDRTGGILVDIVMGSSGNFSYANTTIPNDPYFEPRLPTSGAQQPINVNGSSMTQTQLGSPFDIPNAQGTYRDNIHNHLLDLR